MSSAEVATGPFCTAIGCRDSATAVIEHPDHGRRPVCEDHINGYPTDERLEAEL